MNRPFEWCTANANSSQFDFNQCHARFTGIKCISMQSLRPLPHPAMKLSRRGFLSGRTGDTAEIRPPWAIAAPGFEQQCDRCGDCIAVCPPQIIAVGAGGFPAVDFSAGACDFCAKCVNACVPAALQHTDAANPWPLKASFSDRCLARSGVECRVCGEACETSAIRFHPRLGGAALPELDTSRCNGCGACFSPCPVRAIAMEMHQ